MALDTTVGGASADSYGTAADFSTYAASMGWTLSGTATTQDADMRRAAMYLDRQYVWLGYRANETQALSWPRVVSEYDADGWPIPSDSIPQKIINAQFEIAWVENQGTDLLAAVTDGPIKRIKAKAGPVESETEYAGSQQMTAQILSIDGLIAEYIEGGPRGATSGMVRVARG